MTLSSNFNNLKNHFDLVRTKILDFSNLKWFFLSIITISTLFTVSTSFLLGFQNQQLFTDATTPDTLIISQPKITPAQSQVPLFWIDDIQQLEGIKAVSPETVDLVIDQSHGQTPYFRGVTSNFKEFFSSFTMVSGNYFQINSTQNEIIVGKNYANLFHIKPGDTIVLQSRTKTAVTDVIVSGVFFSQSIADDGLVGPLWMGRLFGGLTDNLVNIIRIKFDPTLYTKTQLQTIILGKHTLQVQVTNPYQYNASISQSTVELYNRYKEKINQSLVDSSGQAVFFVPFGKYYIKLTNPVIQTSKYESIFVQGNLSMNVVLGIEFKHFSAQFSISGEPKANATVLITNTDTNDQYNFTTNSTGQISANEPLGSLKITFKWRNYQNVTVHDHLTGEDIQINFDYLITINFRESQTNNTIANKAITIINLETNKLETVSTNDKGVLIEKLQPDTPYKFISTNNGLKRTVTVSYFNQTTFNFYAGQKTVQIVVKDINIGVLKNYQVNVTITDPETTNTNSSIINTSDSGSLTLKTYAGYLITLKSYYTPANRSFTKEITVENTPEYTFYLGKQPFLVSIADTKPPGDIYPSTILLNNKETSESFNFGLDSNTTKIIFIDYANYSIQASAPKYSYYTEFTFDSATTNKFVINYNAYILEATFYNKNGTSFTGNIIVSQYRHNQYQTVSNTVTNTIQLKLQNGNYKIQLDDTRYFFQTSVTIDSQNSYHTFYVSEKNPEIYPLNFGNYSIVNSSKILFLSAVYSKQVTYHWGTNQGQNYNSQVGIIVPTSEGKHFLTVQSSNYDNVTVTNTYILTVDNTGPIATLLNAKGNNSWIDYSYIPQFSFSETPKTVYYAWDETPNPTSHPTVIPQSIGYHQLRVMVEDFANNSNVFFYIFYFDNQPSQLVNSNPLNNTIIYSSTINLTFSEQIAYSRYSWNGGPFTTSSNPVQIPVPSIDGVKYNLTVQFVDLAGNSNTTTLVFPILDHNPPSFYINTSLWNSTFNQLVDSYIPFYTSNTNNTVFYSWDNGSSWNIIYTRENYNYTLPVPNQNGSLFLSVLVFDEYNPTDYIQTSYLFTGNFTGPQFNASISSYLNPNQKVNIKFPSNSVNWYIYWDNLFNGTGTNSSTVITTPIQLGTYNLTIITFDTMNNITNTFTLVIENAVPHLSNANLTYLSAYNSYTLIFPSYVSIWNYSWSSGGIQSGTNTSTALHIPTTLNGLKLLAVNFTTKYGVTSNFTLPFNLDSDYPQIYLENSHDNSSQEAGFYPKINFSEKLNQTLYNWGTGTNQTSLIPMPNHPINTMVNLTVFIQDFANNWNKTTFSFNEVANLFTLSFDLANSQITNGFVKAGNKLVFNVSSLNPINKFTCSWNNNPEQICNATNVVVPFLQGTFSLTLRVYDTDGNYAYLAESLQSDYSPPVLTYANLQNNTIINSYFSFKYNFSESISSSNSIYAWDSYTNTTGFPLFNDSLNGYHTLHWWFSDNQGNWNYYIFNLFLDRQPPTFSLQGIYSPTVIVANSSIFVIAQDQSSQPLTIYMQWNNTALTISYVNSNSKVSVPLPNTLGNQTLQLMIRDSYNNWNNQTLQFTIKLFLSVEFTDSQNTPLSNVSLELHNKNNNALVASSNNSSKLELFLNQGMYILLLSFTDYNASSTINLTSSSFTKRISLLKVIIDFNNNNQTSYTSVTGTLSWKDDFLISSAISITNTMEMYVPQDATNFKAIINNTTLMRTFQVYQSNSLINFTTAPCRLELQAFSELNNLPVPNARIQNGQNTLGFTNAIGDWFAMVQPGTYDLVVTYQSVSTNLSITIFENQVHTITLPVNSNISVQVLGSDNSPTESVSIYIMNPIGETINLGITNFYGIVNFNNIPWGNYKIKLNYDNVSLLYNLTISGDFDSKGDVFTITLPYSNNLDTALGNNLGKWTFNRNYDLSNPSELSDQTLQNLGFSVIFSTLFLIILVMTFIGLISVQHQPIYKLKDTIANLKRIGSSENQLLGMITFQFTVNTLILTSIGYVVASILVLFWPSLQEFPIAGMIIKPENFNASIFLLQNISFSLITGIFAYYYTKKEYFVRNKKKSEANA